MVQDSKTEKISREIERLALAGEFSQAEHWHKVLLEQHPTALKEIIQSATCIEEQKTLKLDPDHIAIWDSLYSQLTQEETNCLFYSTRSANVPSGKILIRQGKAIARLLFIDRGRLALFHTRGKDRIFIGDLSRGDVAGDETFFSHSTPTFSAGCKTDVQLRYLERSMMHTWKDVCPGLERFLEDYCSKNSRAKQLMSSKHIEKRQFPRIKVSGNLRAYIRLEDGKRSQENIRGSLADISRNGVSFDMHSSNPENARKLLGRILELDFEGLVTPSGALLTMPGTVVKVTALLHNDFNIHIQLAEVIPVEEFTLNFSR